MEPCKSWNHSVIPLDILLVFDYLLLKDLMSQIIYIIHSPRWVLGVFFLFVCYCWLVGLLSSLWFFFRMILSRACTCKFPESVTSYSKEFFRLTTYKNTTPMCSFWTCNVIIYYSLILILTPIEWSVDFLIEHFLQKFYRSLSYNHLALCFAGCKALLCLFLTVHKGHLPSTFQSLL